MDPLRRPLKHIDAASLVTIFVTFVLFGVAVAVKGLTHDLLLEGAVFLVSVKLILMSYKHSAADALLREQLTRIEGAVMKLSSGRTQSERT